MSFVTSALFSRYFFGRPLPCGSGRLLILSINARCVFDSSALRFVTCVRGSARTLQSSSMSMSSFFSFFFRSPWQS